MIRFLLVVLSVGGFLVFFSWLLYLQRRLGRTDRRRMEEESLVIVQRVFRMVLRIAGTKVTVRGLENIPKDQAVLYVGNHRSYFDILVGYTTVPTLMGFVAKKEMRRYPLLAQWMENVNCLFLDRKNPKEGLKTILSGIAQVKRGVSVWIFPEGTRNRSEDPLELMEFKEGSLKIAEKAGCPVIPVAITGTADVFEKHLPFIYPAHVTVEYGKPFMIQELEPDQRKFSGAYTRALIIEMLKAEKERREAERERETAAQV